MHTYALKNTAVPCVNCDRPAFGPLCFSHPVRPAVLIQPINPERAARHGKPSYLTLVSCWLEVIFSPCGQRKSAPRCCFLTFLLMGASGSHLTDLISLISLRRRQLHNHLTARDLNNQPNKQGELQENWQEHACIAWGSFQPQIHKEK